MNFLTFSLICYLCSREEKEFAQMLLNYSAYLIGWEDLLALLFSFGRSCFYQQLPCQYILLYIIIKNFYMKQTVKTSNNYNAVIQIPYEKLAKKSNCVNINSGQKRTDNLSKTIVIPQCHGCYQRPSQPNVSIQMLEELERMYDNDMKQKESQVSELQKRLSDTEKQLTENKNQIQKYKQKTQYQQQSTLKTIKDKDQLISRLTKQLQSSKLQKQALMRTKIAQVQNNFMLSQRAQQEKHQRYISELDKKSKDQLSNLNLSHQAQKDKLRQQYLMLKVQIQQAKAENQRQKLVIQKQLYQSNLKNSYFQKTLEELKNRDKQNVSNIQSKESTIKQRAKKIQQLQLQILSHVKQINEKVQIIKRIQSKIQVIENQNISLKNNYKNADESRNQLLLKRKQSDSLLGQFKNKETLLISQLQAVKKQLHTLQETLKGKDNPKVYQVKIQKVIDRQEYIHCLQTQLQAQKRNGLQLQEDIKRLKIIILQKQKQLKDEGARISELEQTILKLKLYIEQKQKSFAWVVQRQIAKDIDINRGEVNKTYKVFPSQPKIYYQFKSQKPTEPIKISQDQRIVIQDHTITIEDKSGEFNLSSKKRTSYQIGDQIQQ